MSDFHKLLLIIKDTRQRLNDNEISQEVAMKILMDVEKEYKAKCGATMDISIKEMFGDLFESNDSKDLNFLI